MTNHLQKEITEKYCSRFGQLAIEIGYITEMQLTEALACQANDKMHGKAHRQLGAILFESKLMSVSQIEHVMTKLFQRLRQEHHDDRIIS